MNKGIIASQVSFQRGATTLEYVFSYGETTSGVVLRKGAGKNTRWEVEDRPDCFGATREEAVVKFLAMNLEGALPPLKSHRWVNAPGSPKGMMYHCSVSGADYQYTTFDVVHRYCQGCKEPIIFNKDYYEQVQYTSQDGQWVLGLKKQGVVI